MGHFSLFSIVPRSPEFPAVFEICVDVDCIRGLDLYLLAGEWLILLTTKYLLTTNATKNEDNM